MRTHVAPVLLLQTALCLAAPALEVEPPDGFVGDAFELRLDTLVEQNLRVEVRAHDAAEPITLALAAGQRGARFVAVAPGRHAWRLLDDSGEVLAEAQSGPVVRTRTLRVALPVDGPVTVQGGRDLAEVALLASHGVEDAGRVYRWRVDGAGFGEPTGHATRIQLTPGRHEVTVRAQRGLEAAEADAIVEVRLPGALRVTAAHHVDGCDPRRRRCPVRLDATANGGRPPYRFSWRPSLGLDVTLSGAEVRHPLPAGRHLARVRVVDADGLQATADVAFDLKDARVAIGPPPDGLTALATRHGASLEQTARFVVVDAPPTPPPTPGHLCTLRGLGADVHAAYTLGRTIPWDFTVCTAVRRDDDALMVTTRLTAVAGDPDYATTVRCSAAGAACVERAAHAFDDLVGGVEPPESLSHPDAPPPLVTGRLEVRTEQAGAYVRINRIGVGRTPLGLDLPLGRRYLVEVSRDPGAAAQRLSVRLSETAPRVLTFRTAGERSWLTVLSEPGDAAVHVEDEYVGQTPLRAWRVPVGEYRVRVTREGHEADEQVVEVGPDAGPHVVSLRPLGQRLTLVNRGDDRHLEVDRAYLGVLASGTERALDLPDGSHVVCVDRRRSPGPDSHCVQVTMPRDTPLEIDERGPILPETDLRPASRPERSATAHAAPVSLSLPQATTLRLGLSAGMRYHFATERSHYLPEGSAPGVGLGLEGIPLGPLHASTRLEWTYADNTSETRLLGRPLPVAVRQHALSLDLSVAGPVGLDLGAAVRAAHIEETLNPEDHHENDRMLWGVAVGPTASIDLLAALGTDASLRIGYRMLFILAPRVSDDAVGRTHALNATFTWFPGWPL